LIPDRVKELYYTAKQAREVLGLNEHTFQSWVKSRKINRTVLPGHGQGVYLKSEINSKAAQIQSALFFDEAQDLEYRQATISDMDAENYLSYLIFGKRVVTPQAVELTRRLARISPESTYHLYDHHLRDYPQHDHIELAASLNIVPLNHDAITEFIAGKRGWLFGEEAIEKFAPGKPLECIVIDFLSNPCVPPEQRKNYAKRLLMKFFCDTLRKWGENGVEIAKIYSNGGTPEGKRLLETAGGKVINVATHELHPHIQRTIYEIDIASSTKSFLRPYKAALASWRTQHQS